MMTPIDALPAEQLRGVRVLLSDIDDTLTRDGLMPSASIAAMEDLPAPPTWVTRGRSSLGFGELAQALLTAKA